MKGLGAGILLFLFATPVFAQAPDPRDAVILESKLLVAGMNGHPAFTVKVSIKNKDTLAGFTLPLVIKTAASTAFVLLDMPRTFDGTINRHTATLGDSTAFVPFINDTSPDSAIWSGFWNPSDTSTAEAPNPFPKGFWEIKFSHTSDSGGQVLMDSAVVLGNHIGFATLDGNPVRVNFSRSLMNVFITPLIVLNCAGERNIPYGRPYTFDFNADQPVIWSIVSGPGSIDPNSGLYSFTGQCALGSIPVVIRGSEPQFATTCDCEFTLNIIDHPPACAPANATVSVSHGLAATNQINASDPDAGDGLIYSVVSGPGVVDANGVWTYTTGCEDVPISPQTVKIRVSDAFGSCRPGPMADTCQFQLVVTNSPPFFTWPASAPK